MKDVNILKNYGVDLNKSLELLGDMDMYNEVMNDFLSMIDSKVASLEKYRSINDMKNYAIEVHSLKSDVRYLGFMALGDMAYELELRSKENDIASVSAKHPALMAEVKKMIGICRLYLFGEEIHEDTTSNVQTNDIDINSLDPMSQALMYQGTNYQNTTNATNTTHDGTILIVDDSQIVANFVKKVFDQKYDVVILKDGKEAIDYCKIDENRLKIKACLLDLNMPNVNGFEVLEFFNQNNYFVKLPVVIISGVENNDLITKASSYPIIEVLQKPFNERDVEDAVNKCLATYF